MRLKISVFLAIVYMRGLSQFAQAADLQDDWYVKIDGGYVLGLGTPGAPDYGITRLYGKGYFYDTPPGEYGPFLVTEGTSSYDDRRFVFVESQAVNIGSDQSLIMPIYLPIDQGTPLWLINMYWETNYDPHSMLLQIWHCNSSGEQTLEWTQSLGGHRYGEAIFAYDTALDGYYFAKIAIVPEPSTIFTLFSGIASLAGGYVFRRRP